MPPAGAGLVPVSVPVDLIDAFQAGNARQAATAADSAAA